MKSIRLTGVDSTVLLRFLESKFSNALSRLWTTDETTGGVFLYDPEYATPPRDLKSLLTSRKPLLSTSTIVAECNEETLECSVWVSASSLNPYRGDETAYGIAEAIRRFATENGWTVVEPIVKIAGTHCPYCDAVYIYPKTGIVRCHNCGREFEHRLNED
jgi:hypothetical protein